MNALTRYTGILGLSMGLIACGSDNDSPLVTPTPEPEPEPEVNTVVDVAVENGSFTTLVDLLVATGLDETLDDPEGEFTVFAPTDDAFALLGEDTLSALLEDTDTLSDILLYHVISGAEVDSTGAIAAAGTTVAVANGDSVGLSLWGEELLVNLSVVTMVDVEADNGVIHVIDAVLMPPEENGDREQTIAELAQATESLSTLVTALDTAGLVSTFDNPDDTFTVFAPTNDAFAAVGEENIQALLADQEALSAVLSQHVVAETEIDNVTAYSANGTSVETLGGAEIPVSINDNRVLTVGGAEVSITNIYASNGIIHVIDSVIVGDLQLPSPPDSLADVATDNGNFTTLVEALGLAGLADDLDNLDNTFTVFAPTDAAFDALREEVGDDAFNDLLADSEALADVLLYHVIADETILADAAISVAQSNSSIVAMGNGDNAGLSLDGESLLINTSMVTATNVLAENGVIHVIDKVMMPPAPIDTGATITGTAAADGDFSTLVSLLQSSGLDAALDDGSETYTVFAPTNDAFDKVDPDVLAQLGSDPDLLEEVLSNHVVADTAVDSVTAYTLNGTSVTALSGADIGVDIVNGSLQVGGATVTTADLNATNGVIHVIDTVIVGDADLPAPRESIVDVAVANGNFTTLAQLLVDTGLDETLGDFATDFTVFAPTDAAFAELDQATLDALGNDADLLIDVLLYHVISGSEIDSTTAIASAGNTVEMANGDDAGLSLSGGDLLINTSTVTTADVMADNGVIHVIDKVLMPPMPVDAGVSIAAAASGDDRFTTLVDLLGDAGLVAALSDESETYTVFAPTNEAFDNVPQATMDALAADPALLEEVLLTHVVSGVAADSVTAYTLNGTDLETMSTNLISVDIVDGSLQVGGANVIQADINATNGVIHVIDEVIVP